MNARTNAGKAERAGRCAARFATEKPYIHTTGERVSAEDCERSARYYAKLAAHYAHRFYKRAGL